MALLFTPMMRDGLTDLDEYEETKTDPTKKDTDGDELEDGVETDTGTYVSATNTGTDPRNADTVDSFFVRCAVT